MANKSKFTGELIHFGAARLRTTGSGNLRLTLYSLDDVKSSVLSPIVLESATDKEPLALANFTNQRGYLEFKTTAIDETFVVSKITLFIKVVASGRPQ